MKLYEIISDKKGKSLIHLFFTDKKLKIKNEFSNAMYYHNTKQWKLVYNSDNVTKLKLLGFQVVYPTIPDLNDIDNLLIENNYIIIKANDISRYLIAKKFTQYDTSECFVNRKFDFSKAKAVNFYYLDEFHIYIPIGLKKELFDFLTFSNIKYKDIRKIRKFKFSDDEIKNILNNITLYDYQFNIIKTMFENPNGIIKATTGAGKTEIFLAFMKLTKLKTLILTSSIEIAKQTHIRGNNAGLHCGLVQGTNVKEENNTICTIKSGHKLKNDYDCVIIDECHEISYIHEDILSNKNILYRFGFSATPFTKNVLKNTLIKQYTGEIIYEVKSTQLQNDNKIAIPYINMIKIENNDLQAFSETKNWRTVEKMFIIENYTRNNIIINYCMKLKHQKIVLIKKIDHGNYLQQLFLQKGVDCEFIHGDTKNDERQRILNKFEENKHDFILIGSKILFTGINLQNIFNLFIACGGNSYIEIIQALGRGLRNKTKTKINIFDFMDMGNTYTERHSKNRISYYKDEGFTKIKIIEGEII